METTSNRLPFLDVSIAIKNAAFDTKVYRKPTNTGVLMNFQSMAPTKWKKTLIKCLLNRALRLSSSFDNLQSEIETITSHLKDNGYPDRLVKNICKEFIESKNITNDSFILGNKHEPDHRMKVARKNNAAYLSVPYVGRPSLKLQHRIRKEMEDHDISILAAYTTTKVGSYFNLKPSCPQPFQSNVVYQFSCFRDESITYIGETRRQLFRRVVDHIGKDKNSAVYDHLYQCSDCQGSNNIFKQFRVIHKCTRYNILSFESLLIAKHRPLLNTQLGPGRGTMISLSLY